MDEKAGAFIKEHKLLSAALKGIAEYSPVIVKPIAGFAYGVTHQLGYGITLPGASSQGRGLIKKQCNINKCYEGQVYR